VKTCSGTLETLFDDYDHMNDKATKHFLFWLALKGPWTFD
jgi:hypothetical protein